MSGRPVPSQLDQVLPRFYVQKAGPYPPFGKVRIAPFGKGGLWILAESGYIHPDIIAGVSIGAFNGAIIAGNFGEAAAALEGFWNDLAIATPFAPTETWRRALSSWWTMWLGSSHLFRPHWWRPPQRFPWTWTSLYDLAPAKILLEKYVDFSRLRESPVRLLVSTVNVETAELEVFDNGTSRPAT